MQVNSTPVEMVSPDGSSKSFNLGVTDAQQQSQFFTFGQVPTTSATLTGYFDFSVFFFPNYFDGLH